MPEIGQMYTHTSPWPTQIIVVTGSVNQYGDIPVLNFAHTGWRNPGSAETTERCAAYLVPIVDEEAHHG